MTTNIVSTECLVLGGGIAGLACAAEISKRGIDTIVVESEAELCQHTSSHNSEVIHSGIYYKNESFKAKLCIEGNELLYGYCIDKGISFNKIGKLIVLCEGEDPSNLEKIYLNGIKNNVPEISIINEKKIKQLEPNLKSELAIFSKSTGIIDSHDYALSLQAEIESADGHILTNAPFLNGTNNSNGWRVEIGGLTPCLVNCNYLINATGFNAVSIGKSLGIKELSDPYHIIGHYYSYGASSPFSHLIYPIPTAGGLGIHSTMDLYGKTRFGPDSERIEELSYSFMDNQERRKLFDLSIQQYFPDYISEQLIPDYTGIRTRLALNHADADFSILSSTDHKLDGLINISGYESPGLTSSLALAKYVSLLI